MTDPSGPAPRTEGPSGHEASPTDDARVPWRVFLAVGSFVGLLTVVYWFTAYEDAGTALLAVAAVLGLWCGIYLWLQHRPRPGEATGDGPGGGEPPVGWLPHASVWPFAIGLGTATVFNGLVLGIWVIVPGAALLALGVGGFVVQTRRRD